MNFAVGLDLGGTNIKGLAVTPGGKVLASVVQATGDRGNTAWQCNVRRTYDALCRAAGATPTAVGLAAPGLPARDQRSIAFMPGRLRGLEGLEWQEFLRLPFSMPVLNDAQAALLGEVWRGAARGATNALLLTLGSGVGGAAMVDGHLLRGHLGRAGHLGHISLDPGGAPDIVSTPGSLEDAIGECTIPQRTGGRYPSTQALVAAARAGDPEAKRLWLGSVQALAAGVVSLVNVLDPEVVILGGGIAQAGPQLFRPLKRFLDRMEWRPGGARVRVVPAKLGERAGAFGAAWQALQWNELKPA